MSKLLTTHISDNHSRYNIYLGNLKEGDILFHSGDAMVKGEIYEQEALAKFIEKALYYYDHFVMTPGNHDMCYDVPYSYQLDYAKKLSGFDNKRSHLLINEALTLKNLKIFGFPYTPKFGYWGFMVTPEKMELLAQKIPDDTELLLSHGPLFGNLDWTGQYHAGSEELLKRVTELKNLKLMQHGHIHESYGAKEMYTDENQFMLINAALSPTPYTRKPNPFQLEWEMDGDKKEITNINELIEGE